MAAGWQSTNLEGGHTLPMGQGCGCGKFKDVSVQSLHGLTSLLEKRKEESPIARGRW